MSAGDFSFQGGALSSALESLLDQRTVAGFQSFTFREYGGDTFQASYLFVRLQPRGLEAWLLIPALYSIAGMHA